ncbi:exosortase F system-associated protein [Flavobacterium sp.]|uniref:exosortase F system-associated membrane protein n=1 Tax=Flavobacterium sp. TaxID=239 RepID=UPI002609B634|nr:exosortase F system-associated protein [Flavobacterium sp.]
MLKKILQHKLRTAIFVVLVCMLAVVRLFEKKLFYDPFLAFFKSEFTAKPLPEFDGLQLAVGLFMRYFFNAVISLAMIYVAFKQKELVRFSAVLYGLFFVILMISFFLVIYFSGPHNNLVLFYVRRFLIQPLFVVLFLPAFYYQEQLAKK